MKIMIICLLLLFGGHCLRAQTIEEWTQQKETAIKRLLEQIIANSVYLDYVTKGYGIVKDGLHTIRAIRSGDFHLHLGFIDSLKIVNPSVKQWTKVAAIIAAQVRIVKQGKQIVTAVRSAEQFTPEELSYCTRVIDQLFTACLQTIDELMLLISSGNLSMSDDERIQRIEKIYLDMQEKSSFVSAFGSEVKLLAVQRLAEQTELNYSKK
jgi:hypothetical protein